MNLVHTYYEPVPDIDESIQQKEIAIWRESWERWGWQTGDVLEASALGMKHSWLYRGQVVPTNRLVTVEAWVTAVDDDKRIMTAAGFLSVDGKTIYQMNEFTVCLESQR